MNKQYHVNLKELNRENTQLFINEIELEYKKYFIPSEMGIYTIRLNFNIFMKDCSYMFFDCESITSIDLSSFNTSEVVDMAYMFSGCLNLYSINLTLFNTSRVKGMSNMFSECHNLNSIDLSSFDTKCKFYVLYV